jgi:flagellar biosynthetic protein FlhB
LEEFRRKGQVAQSKEVAGLIALLAAGTACFALSPSMGAQMSEFMKEVFRDDISSHLDLASPAVAAPLMIKSLKLLAVIGLPVCLVGFVFGVFGSFIQIGSIFSTEPLTPDLSKIDPISGLKRFFTMRQVYEGLRLVFKMSVVAAVAYSLVRSEIFRSPEHMGIETQGILASYGQVASRIFFTVCGVLAIFAGFDFWLQRWEFSKNVRLTKEEAKQEHKEREGSPQIKARIRSVQREMARRRMMQAVKKADVIVTNPTHIAVAIVYEKDKMAAPKVVAKGADFLAERIKKIAREAGVPLVENVPLARALFKSVKVGQGIPRALYQAVAEVLAYVYRLKNRGV